MTDKDIIKKLDSCIQNLDNIKDFLIDEQMNQTTADEEVGLKILKLKRTIDEILDCKIDYLNTNNKI